MLPLAAIKPKILLPIRYLFRDLFTTEVAAGALDGTAATPGLGDRASTDASALMAIKPWIGGASVQDETGASFGPANNRCSYYPGQAWIGFNGLDLGAAPLTADTWYLCRMLDSTGNMAYCYVKGGDVGPGETLGDELVTNGGFDSDITGWNNGSLVFDTFEWVDGKLHLVSDGSDTALGGSDDNISLVAKKQYRVLIDLVIVSGALSRIGLRQATTSGGFLNYTGASESKQIYWNLVESETQDRAISFYSYNAVEATLDNVSIKEVLTPPATALYAYVSPGGAQGWLMDLQFNMNDTAYTFDIYPLGANQLVCVSGLATPAQGSPYLGEPAQARALGKTFIFGPFNINDVTKILEIGLDDNQSGAIVGSALRITGDTIVPVDAGTGGSNLYTPADATAYYFAIRLLAAGAEYYLKTATGNWIKLWRGGTDATASLYPGVSNYSAAFTLGKILVVPSWNPPVLAYDSFTRADGVVGSTESVDADGLPAPVKAWSGGAISGNAMVITPELATTGGPLDDGNLVTDGDMESDPVTNWPISDNTITSEETTIVHGGAKSLKLTDDGISSKCNQPITTEIGKWYFFDGWIYNLSINTGSWLARIAAANAAATSSANWIVNNIETIGVPANDTWTRNIGVFRATATTTYILLVTPNDTGDAAYFDDISGKAISLPSTLSLLDLGTADVIMRPTASAFTAGTQLGVALAVDSVTNPQNGIFAYVDGTYVYLDVLIAGVWTNKIKSTTAYVDGKLPHIYRDGTYVAMYYNDALLGSAITLSGAENTALRGTLHGAFSTYSDNGIADIGFSARGTGGEFNSLNRYLR